MLRSAFLAFGLLLSLAGALLSLAGALLSLAGALLSLAGAAMAAANPDAVAIIIGNKTYQNHDVPEVKYADRDAAAMLRYVVDTLGYDERNVEMITNATQANMRATFGGEKGPQGSLLWRRVREGRSDVFVYYSGHGVPGAHDAQAYLLPVDADPGAGELNGYDLRLLYGNLGKLKARSVTVVLDACFSGGSGGGALIRNASVLVRPSSTEPPPEAAQVTVLTASGPTEFASWDDSTQHGAFTAYFLRAVYGAADDPRYGGHGDGKITLGAVKRYLDEEMTYAVRRQQGREQQASVTGDPGLVLAAIQPGHPPVLPDPKLDKAAAGTVAPLPAGDEVIRRAQGMLDRHEYSAALPLLRDAAEKGSAVAMTLLGRAYLYGWGIPQDYAEAMRQFRQAADRGNAAGMNGVGAMYGNGFGVPANPVEAMRWYRMAADKGEALAMTNISILYHKGAGVARDDAEALRWARRSAEAGDPGGLNMVGYMYAEGYGVGRDDAEAMRWYRRAADAGSAVAMLNLGTNYRTGRGVAVDYAEATRWFRKAAERGEALAALALGQMAEGGVGMSRDDTEALRWYRMAAAKNVPLAMLNIGIYYGTGRTVPKDEAEAATWYRRAANLGNTTAMTYLGQLYLRGGGVEQNDAEAIRWFRQAAEAGDPGGMASMGYAYGEGRGVPKDEAAAVRWYRQAADKGYPLAMSSLALFYRTGRGIVTDYAEAKRLYLLAIEKQEPSAYMGLAIMNEEGLGMPRNQAEAMRLYQQAAQLGNAEAKARLASLANQPSARPAPIPAPAAASAPVPAVSYADERTDWNVLPRSDLQYNVASPTPTSIPYARILSTSELSQMINDAATQRTPLVLIDALDNASHATIVNARRLPYAGRAGQFNDPVQKMLGNDLLQLSNGQFDMPMVFFCQGAQCWESYNAALRAARLGYRNVYWYRGGLEAWRAARLPMTP